MVPHNHFNDPWTPNMALYLELASTNRASVTVWRLAVYENGINSLINKNSTICAITWSWKRTHKNFSVLQNGKYLNISLTQLSIVFFILFYFIFWIVKLSIAWIKLFYKEAKPENWFLVSHGEATWGRLTFKLGKVSQV